PISFFVAYTTLFRSRALQSRSAAGQRQGAALHAAVLRGGQARRRHLSWALGARERQGGAGARDDRREDDPRGSGERGGAGARQRSEEHTSELQSREN